MVSFPLRFSLRHLLLGMAVAAIFLGLISTLLSLMRYTEAGQVYNQVSYLTFSSDGAKLAVVLFNARDAGVPGKLYVSDASRIVAVLDTDTLSKCAIVQHELRPGIQVPIGWRVLTDRSVVFTPDGGGLHVLAQAGGQIRTWDIASNGWSNVRVVDETEINGFAFSPNGDWLAISTRLNGVTVWDMRSRKPRFSTSTGSWLFNFSTSSEYLAIAGRGVEMWNVQKGELVGTLHQSRDVLDRVTCVAFSPDGDTIAVRCKEGLRLYSLSTGKEQVILPEHFEVHRTAGGWGTSSRTGEATRGVAFSPDGNLLAAWGAYGLKFFDTSQGCELVRSVTDPSIIHLAFSPDGKTYATGDANGKVAIWDVTTGKEIRSTVLHGNALTR